MSKKHLYQACRFLTVYQAADELLFALHRSIKPAIFKSLCDEHPELNVPKNSTEKQKEFARDYAYDLLMRPGYAWTRARSGGPVKIAVL